MDSIESSRFGLWRMFALALAIVYSGGRVSLLCAQLPEFEPPEQITTSSFLWGSAVSPDGLELYVTDWNNNEWDIKRVVRPSINEPWPDSVGETVTELKLHDAEDEISFTADGLIAIYNSGYSFYQSTRLTSNAPWGKPVSLGVTGWAGSVSSDGLSLYYTENMWSDSAADVFVSTRSTVDERFPRGTRLKSINTDHYRESSPHISADGLSIYFVSDRPGGFGLDDIWYARRPALDQPFGEPENLGPNINTDRTEWSPFTTDDGTLYYTRNAVRDVCCWYIWEAKSIPVPVIDGDFNGDRVLDASDLSQLRAAINVGAQEGDLNHDGQVSWADQDYWVWDLKRTFFGDANWDGEFDSGDLVTVFIAGEFEDALVGNSNWSTGDWTGDAEFDSADLVRAFQDGGFEAGPRAAALVVPEPASPALLVVGLVTFTFYGWNHTGKHRHVLSRPKPSIAEASSD